jgi:hypothetical protein
MKILWYSIIGILIFGSLKIIVTSELPSEFGGIEVDFPVALMVAGFILYGAYIIWDELV